LLEAYALRLLLGELCTGELAEKVERCARIAAISFCTSPVVSERKNDAIV